MLIRNVDARSDLHVDFVPMVDVLFNLLIFFLLATSIAQTEREMKIALPHAASAGPISAAPREVIINVAGDGKAVVGGKVVADADHSPDLFWAVRGGGGNFGVVTRMKFELHPLPQFTGGPLVLPATADQVAGRAETAAHPA